MYLSKFLNVFVQVALMFFSQLFNCALSLRILPIGAARKKREKLPIHLYLSQYQNILVQTPIYIGLNSQIHLSKLQNIFVHVVKCGSGLWAGSIAYWLPPHSSGEQEKLPMQYFPQNMHQPLKIFKRYQNSENVANNNINVAQKCRCEGSLPRTSKLITFAFMPIKAAWIHGKLM